MMELSIHRPTGYDAYDFYLYEYGPGRTVYYITMEKGPEDEFPSWKRNELSEAQVAKPFMRITGPFVVAYEGHHVAMQLVDWLCDTFRIEPKGTKAVRSYNTGKLEAMQEHLADMRRLVFEDEPKVEYKLKLDPELRMGEEVGGR